MFISRTLIFYLRHRDEHRECLSSYHSVLIGDGFPVFYTTNYKSTCFPASRGVCLTSLPAFPLSGNGVGESRPLSCEVFSLPLSGYLIWHQNLSSWNDIQLIFQGQFFLKIDRWSKLRSVRESINFKFFSVPQILDFS